MKKIVLFFIALSVFTTLSFAQTAPPFWNDIVAFRKQDSIRPVPANPVLFVGSSSFTKWQDVNSYFPGYPIINRGFGGSTLPDIIRYAYDIILPYHPKQVLIYCGENDLASSETVTAAEVVKRFKTLYGILRLNLPDAVIGFVSIKPSPSRKFMINRVIEANKGINAFLKKEKKAAFIDIFPQMLDAQGNAREELFLEDRLHMKPEGYAIWARAIKPCLLK